MSDEAQPKAGSGLPPVRMALRVVARHGVGRAGGRRLARAVRYARAPKHLAASTRIALPGGGPVDAPAPRSEAPLSQAPAEAVARAPQAPGRPSAATAGFSDFAAEF